MQGPVSDAGQESFVNYHSVAVRHGMTIGELAKLYNAERRINANLTVVPMKGWMRGDWFDSTGVEWVNPSPNLRNLEQAILYPGVALIEGTNVSVGRGTDTPFQVVGAPWIKSKQLAAYLNARLIAGVRFVPTEFTPTSSTYAGQAMRRSADHRDQSRDARCAGAGHRTRGSAAQAVSATVRTREDEHAAGESGSTSGLCRLARIRAALPKTGAMGWTGSCW